MSGTGDIVASAINFVSAYMPSIITNQAANYLTSPSGLIAMGFMVYGFLKPTPIADPATLASMKSIVNNDTLYDSVINFFLDMSPISIAVGIPKNVRSWFYALKDRFTDRPDSIIGFKSYIVQKFINVNNTNSTDLIQFSGSFIKIMSCIWDGIMVPEHKYAFFTNYYGGITTHYANLFHPEIIKELQQHALSLIAEEVQSQQQFRNPQGQSRGGSSSTLKHKRKRRSNNKKKQLKVSKKSNKNKRRTSKNKKKR